MLLDEIRQRWSDIGEDPSKPIVRSMGRDFSLADIAEAGRNSPADSVPAGSVVALVGDFTPLDIVTLLRLIDAGCVVVPLTDTTANQHRMFFDIAGVEWVIRHGAVERLQVNQPRHVLISQLLSSGSSGLILFSSGTTGTPKATVHNFSNLLEKFRSYRRPALRTLAFLLFDHWGGLNTLFHTLFNAGTLHVPVGRQPASVIKQAAEEGINLIPTTPSFLRLALVDHAFDGVDLSQLGLITYGTERMDQPTLDRLNQVLPDHVDIRQTYGLSELGVFRISNLSKRELWIRISDPEIEVEAREGSMWIRSPQRMLGYLNAPSPFDEEGWFNTRDLVEFNDGFFRILGRVDDVINVGGVKVHPTEVEEAAYGLPEVCYARACAEPDPFLGQHIRLELQLVDGVSVGKKEIRSKLSRVLVREQMPHRIEFQDIPITARFKRA